MSTEHALLLLFGTTMVHYGDPIHGTGYCWPTVAVGLAVLSRLLELEAVPINGCTSREALRRTNMHVKEVDERFSNGGTTDTMTACTALAGLYAHDGISTSWLVGSRHSAQLIRYLPLPYAYT
jgi:hypothetical protein